MGLFDRLTGKKPPPEHPGQNTPAGNPGQAAPDPEESAPGDGSGAVMPRLADAKLKLDARDLVGAVAIYEEVLASSGDRADVLVTISGDLGTSGHVGQIIELVAPRYDAERHGPATGINIVQAYLAVRDPNAAQHVLDLLFALRRPDIEERLLGFSNAIADLMAMPSAASDTVAGAGGPGEEKPTIGLITYSRPMWFYGFEAMEDRLLPAKEGRLRRIAFAQLALPGAYRNLPEALKRPEDELGRFSRGLALWLTETFYLSAQYQPIAATGLHTDPAGAKCQYLFPAEWTSDNLQQLVDNTESGLDYIFTGSLRHSAGDFSLTLRLFEVKKFRERKTFSARWSPATADAELAKLHGQIRAFMEWAPEKGGIAPAMPVSPSAWIETLATSLSLFLAEKGILPQDKLPPVADALVLAGRQAGESEIATLAYLALRHRAIALGLTQPGPMPALFASPLVDEARSLVSA